MIHSLSKLNLVAKTSIYVTEAAWSKMSSILKQSNSPMPFLFYVDSGGCNGFNYRLKPITIEDVNSYSSLKIKPTMLNHCNVDLIVDPQSEMYLLGTTIDYVHEDLEKNIYESRFVFTPDKTIASSCGCGISFSPRALSK